MAENGDSANEPMLSRRAGSPGGAVSLTQVLAAVERHAGYLAGASDDLRVPYGDLVHFLGMNGYSERFLERFEAYREEACEAALFRLVRQGNAEAAVFWAERAERRATGSVTASGDASGDLAGLLEDAARRVPALGWKLYEALGRVLDEVDPGMRERPDGLAPRGMAEAVQGAADPERGQVALPAVWHFYCPDGEGILGVPMGWYGEVAYRKASGLIPEPLSLEAGLSYHQGAVIRLCRSHDGWVPRSKAQLPEMTLPKNLVYIVS
jgi:hypothetical protein